ncbi:MAG: hypothetical protein HZA54_19380, partial [Planctomycetes bacterium]|nr:hypothetical protein [Planctomycetota bacterium]
MSEPRLEFKAPDEIEGFGQEAGGHRTADEPTPTRGRARALAALSAFLGLALLAFFVPAYFVSPPPLPPPLPVAAPVAHPADPVAPPSSITPLPGPAEAAPSAVEPTSAPDGGAAVAATATPGSSAATSAGATATAAALSPSTSPQPLPPQLAAAAWRATPAGRPTPPEHPLWRALAGGAAPDHGLTALRICGIRLTQPPAALDARSVADTPPGTAAADALAAALFRHDGEAAVYRTPAGIEFVLATASDLLPEALAWLDAGAPADSSLRSWPEDAREWHGRPDAPATARACAVAAGRIHLASSLTLLRSYLQATATTVAVTARDETRYGTRLGPGELAMDCQEPDLAPAGEEPELRALVGLPPGEVAGGRGRWDLALAATGAIDIRSCYAAAPTSATAGAPPAAGRPTPDAFARLWTRHPAGLVAWLEEAADFSGSSLRWEFLASAGRLLCPPPAPGTRGTPADLSPEIPPGPPPPP